MKKYIIYALLLSLIFLSFKIDKKKTIIRTWHAVRLESPQLDSFFKTSNNLIDTLGKNNDDATNMELYGVTNMDSVRRLLRFQLDSAMDVQMGSVRSTVFTFRKDSILVVSFDSGTDSCKWDFDKAGKLALIPLYDTELVRNMNMEIVALSDTVLRLKFVEENAYSIVTFYPERK